MSFVRPARKFNKTLSAPYIIIDRFKQVLSVTHTEQNTGTALYFFKLQESVVGQTHQLKLRPKKHTHRYAKINKGKEHMYKNKIYVNLCSLYLIGFGVTGHSFRNRRC